MGAVQNRDILIDEFGRIFWSEGQVKSLFCLPPEVFKTLGISLDTRGANR